MSKEDLKSFKIGDTTRPTVSRPSKAEPDHSAAAEAASVGFRRIERMIENEEPSKVAATLSDLAARLEAHGGKVKSQRDKAAVKKAIAAVERTADLMDYLFQVKDAMRQQG